MISALLITTCLVAGADETVFNLKELLAPPLNARTLKKTEQNGIVTEEVMFHSEADAGKDVEIFAFFSYPQHARQLPAFIWNQGGLAQASTYWTEFGAKRGYAALCIDFPMPGYRSTGSYPIVSGLELGDDPKRAPIYHGAVALLRAVSFLQSRSEVDGDKIGMAGSSWGGFYTTLMVGIDPRLKVGSCMFGSGRLDLGNLWWDGQGWDAKRDAAFRQRWRTTLDPAVRLADRKTPIAWFTGTNDQFYWLPSVVASYEAAAGPKHLALLPNWNHALTPEVDEQVFAWLDVHLKNAAAFTTLSPLTIRNEEEARWDFSGPRKIVRAELLLSHGEAGNWKSRFWQTIPAKIEGNTCIALLPKAAVPSFITATVTDQDGFRTATPLVRLAETATAAKPDYDGASLWGGFEPPHTKFLELHGLKMPTIIKAAKQGAQAAALKPGDTRLGPILFTSGLPHRLSLFLKSDTAAEVTLALEGRFDGRPMREQSLIKAAPAWTQATLDFTPPNALTGDLNLVITLPPGAEISLDAVQFRPK